MAYTLNDNLKRWAERDVIHTIGMTAFNKTMKKLIADEKARNNSDGDNKQ